MNGDLLVIILLILFLGSIAIRHASGTGLFRFPFLFCGIWIAFVLLDFGEFILKGGALYAIYHDTGVVGVALILLVGSAICGLGGYALVNRRMASSPGYRPQTIPPSQIRFMHIASIVVAGLAGVAFVALANLGGGLRAYIFSSGGYDITYEGLPVYLIFVVRFIYGSIVIQLWIWARTRNNFHLILALLFSIISFIQIFFLFRRSEVIIIGVFYGYFLTNYYNFRIGRLQAFMGVAAMIIVLRLFPLLRGEEGSSNLVASFWQAIGSERLTFENSEIGSALYRLHESIASATFGYGTMFWNAFVKQFVPAGLVGHDFKSSLMFDTIEYGTLTFASFKYYISPMGFAQIYQEFWYFGVLVFGLIGALIAKMEHDRFRSPRHEIFLVLLIPALLSTISADMTLIVSRAIIYGVLVMVCVPRSLGLPVPARPREGARPAVTVPR
jgi:hypothetical protein